MFSRILIKLIDQSITPAILLVSVRILAVMLVSRYFDIEFRVGANGFTFTSAKDYVLVNSYSTFFMIVVLVVGLLYILAKSFYFHESHIKPSVTAKLFSYKLQSFIQSSFDLYSQGSIWLSYTYLVMIASGLMVFFKLVYPWVFYVSLILCIVSTVLLILDVENELKDAKEQ